MSTEASAASIVALEPSRNDSSLDYGYEDTWTMGVVHADNAAIYQGVLPLICGCGILGIILTLIVLTRKNMKTSTNCYLTALAIADLIFLILFATYLPTKSVNLATSTVYVIYISYAVTLMNMFLIASSWLTVMLAIERYIAICRPFLAARVCTAKKAKIAIVLIFIFALLLRLPNFWEMRIASGFDPETNSTVIYHEPTSLSFNDVYMQVYPWLVDGIFSSILPFILLLVLNLRLIWEVRKSTVYIQRNMGGGNSSNTIQREELQITVMLISVIIVFFICQAPYVTYTVVVSINKYQSSGSGFLLFRDVATLLLVLKSAVNFILYCWFSEKFWATLKRIFCVGNRCLCNKKRTAESNGANYLHLRRFSSCATRDSTF